MLTDDQRLALPDAAFFAVTDATNSRKPLSSPYRNQVKPKPKQKPEAAIQTKIIKWLEKQGAIVLRTNSGVFKGESGHRVQGTAPGTSDLTVCWCGRFVAIEVKNEGEQPTAKQQRYLDRVNAQGGLAFVARSVDDVKRHLAELEPCTV